MIKQLAIILILFSPLGLLSTSKPANKPGITLQDIRQGEGLFPPRPVNQPAAQPTVTQPNISPASSGPSTPISVAPANPANAALVNAEPGRLQPVPVPLSIRPSTEQIDLADKEFLQQSPSFDDDKKTLTKSLNSIHINRGSNLKERARKEHETKDTNPNAEPGGLQPVPVPLSIRPSTEQIDLADEEFLQQGPSFDEDEKTLPESLSSMHINHGSSLKEHTEKERKEQDPDDVYASSQEWHEMKKSIRELMALIYQQDPTARQAYTIKFNTHAENLLGKWASNKITSRIFQAMDDQAPNEEIIKLFKQLPKKIDPRDYRQLFSIFQTQQEVVSGIKQDVQFIIKSIDPKKIHSVAEQINWMAQERERIITIGSRQYQLQELMIRFLHGYKGFSPLMKASAQGNEELVEFLIDRHSNIMATTDIVAWMSQDNAFIFHEDEGRFPDCFIEARAELKNLCDRYLRDIVGGYRPQDEPEHGASELFKNILHTFYSDYDALSLAALAGHSNIIDRLLKQLIDNHEDKKGAKSIRYALIKLAAFSDPATADCARGLLASLGITEPKRNNYLAIAQKLMRAYIIASPKEVRVCKDIRIQLNENLNVSNESKSQKALFQLLLDIMRHGSPEIFEVIAQEITHCKFPFRLAMRHKFFDEILCGEKLGILFSINAEGHTMSNLRLAMLRCASNNAALLARLQQFICKHQILPQAMEEVNKYLLPELASIVRDYISFHRAPEPEVCDGIWDSVVAHQQLKRAKNDEKKED